jgi:hypothetical protein
MLYIYIEHLFCTSYLFFSIFTSVFIDFHCFFGHTVIEPIFLYGVCTMTIEDYRIQLGWSLAELARKADIDVNTLKRAINGVPVYKRIAGAIATALSQGLGQTLTYKDLDGVLTID